MRTEDIRVALRDGTMGAHVAFPARTPAPAIIAIMEIWGVNDTMRRHAQEFAEAWFPTSSGARNRASSSTTRIPRT
jgi:carboxymethylenebutenolidase